MDRVELKIHVMVNLQNVGELERLQKATLDQPVVQINVPVGGEQHAYSGRFIGAQLVAGGDEVLA
jgi:hypothetical protein